MTTAEAAELAISRVPTSELAPDEHRIVLGFSANDHIDDIIKFFHAGYAIAKTQREGCTIEIIIRGNKK